MATNVTNSSTTTTGKTPPPAHTVKTPAEKRLEAVQELVGNLQDRGADIDVSNEALMLAIEARIEDAALREGTLYKDAPANHRNWASLLSLVRAEGHSVRVDLSTGNQVTGHVVIVPGNEHGMITIMQPDKTPAMFLADDIAVVIIVPGPA